MWKEEGSFRTPWIWGLKDSWVSWAMVAKVGVLSSETGNPSEE